MLHELKVLENSDLPAEEVFGGVKAWRSLDHKRDSEDFSTVNKGEFRDGALEEPKAETRRDFMKIMGASMALAGLTSCRRPVENILPYARKPEEVVPGLPLSYATGFPFKGSLQPLLVEAHEGRPTKIEGNPEHPDSQGSTDVFSQASILNLYDPDRSRYILQGGAKADKGQLLDYLRSWAPSTRLAVIASTDHSPTRARLKTQLAGRFSSMRWVDYDDAGPSNAALGAQQVCGLPARLSNDFSKAQTILSLGSDFLGSADSNSVSNARGYADSRRVMSTSDSMSRLYVVESDFTNTGGMADHRLRVKASSIGAFATALAARLGVAGVSGGNAGGNTAWMNALVADLQSSRGASIVVAGDEQAPELHALVMHINAVLGNIGKTVDLLDTGVAQVSNGCESLASLAQDASSGAIDAIVILDCNPVFSAPGGVDVAAMLGAVESLHLGMWNDETAAASRWHLPSTHYLEAWGDGRSFSGLSSVVQPLIAPLYEDSTSPIELLALMATGVSTSGYDLVRATWSSGQSNQSWRKLLHDGFVPGSGFASITPSAMSSARSLSGSSSDLELVVKRDPAMYDGRFSNNAWMIETPDPITKVVWDNVAMMSPATAEKHGLVVNLSKGKHLSDVISIEANGTSVDLPIWIVPGHADDSITVNLGYGRNISTERSTKDYFFFDKDVDVYNGGPIGNGVGSNVAALRSASGASVITNVSVSKKDSGYLVASTQDHGYMEGRAIVRMASLEEYKSNPNFAPDEVPSLKGLEPWDEYPTLWEDRHPKNAPSSTENWYNNHQWGMVVDLNTCNGCNACVVACTSENNVQVVGKDQVSRGRELHWMRLDRYFVGNDEENPEMVVQPMMCAHCENAPCEAVCPVAATVHSPDGLNVMVYNRCIGTRYCANNCPYKVRRFNFYNWTKTIPEQVKLAQNPNVSVRFRGVMEKCSYCIQRIRGAGHEARKEDRLIQDNEVTTACQQVCPANAISFGDLAIESSEVNKLKQNNRNYELLSELNVKPRSSYLARLKNPNPALATATAGSAEA